MQPQHSLEGKSAPQQFLAEDLGGAFEHRRQRGLEHFRREAPLDQQGRVEIEQESVSDTPAPSDAARNLPAWTCTASGNTSAGIPATGG